jgi:hypothetical protein
MNHGKAPLIVTVITTVTLLSLRTGEEQACQPYLAAKHTGLKKVNRAILAGDQKGGF